MTASSLPSSSYSEIGDTMPYVITTIRPSVDGKKGIGTERVERRAVATREEAQAEQDRLLAEQGRKGGFVLATGAVRVGPLPDGTVIEVEPKVWKWLYDHSGGRLLRPVTECTKASILAAFNAAQAA